jgi:hypothetical protein
MDELEQALRHSTALNGPWTPGHVREVLQCITSCITGASFDWEEGNENWASIWTAEDHIAKVSAKMPLVLVQKRYAEVIRDCAIRAGAMSLGVSSFAEGGFCVPKELLERIFGRPLTSVVNYDKLSINDLWYATAT